MDIVLQKEKYINSLYEEEQRLKGDINDLIKRYNELNPLVIKLINDKEELIRELGDIKNRTIQLEMDTRKDVIHEIELGQKEVSIRVQELEKLRSDNIELNTKLSNLIKDNDYKYKQIVTTEEELKVKKIELDKILQEQKTSLDKIGAIAKLRMIETNKAIELREEAEEYKDKMKRLKEVTEGECAIMIEKNKRDEEMNKKYKKELDEERIELNSLWEQLKNAKKK